MKNKIEKIIAKEGLILITLAAVLYFALLFCKTAPVMYPEYKAQFADGKEYTVVIYPDMNYKSAFDPGILLKEIHNPPLKLVSKRIEEFARQAKIDSKPVNAVCVNIWQLRLSEVYSRILLQLFIVKLFFIYVILILIRFIAWAIGTLRDQG